MVEFFGTFPFFRSTSPGSPGQCATVVRRRCSIAVVAIGVVLVMAACCGKKDANPEGVPPFALITGSLQAGGSLSNLSEPALALSLPEFRKVPYISSPRHQLPNPRKEIVPRELSIRPPLSRSLETALQEPATRQLSQPVRIKVKTPAFEVARDPYTRTENPYSFIFFGRSQGMQHDDISVMRQDPSGVMWIATYGAGLIRYDGTHFSYFDTETGLPDNQVLSLRIDSQGHLWIGTRVGGLVRFDGTHYIIYNTDTGLPNNSIEAILEDRNGNLWVGTYGGGVSKIMGDQVVHYDTSHGLAGNIVYTLLEDQDGNIWMGTRGGGVSMFDGETFFTWNQSQGMPSEVFLASAQDKQGRIWLATNGGGLLMYDQGKWLQYSTPQGMPDHDVMSVFVDNKNRIWLGTRSQGLLRLENDQIVQFNTSNGLTNNYITHITQDRCGLIWLGTYGGGVGQYRGDAFMHFAQSQGLSDSFIRTVSQDTDGLIWMGSNLNGVYVFDGQRFVNVQFTDPAIDNRIRSLLHDSNGRLWLGTASGQLLFYHQESFYALQLSSASSQAAITDLMEDHRGRIWITTHGDGLFCIDHDVLFHFTNHQGLPDLHLRKIVEDNQGNFWLASRTHGVIFFNEETFVYYNRDQGLANDFFDLNFDSRGILWAASNGSGVFVLMEGKYVNLTERNGLGSNFVYSLLEDQEAGMWFGTRLGFSRLLHPEAFENGQLHHLQQTMPFQAGVFFQNFARNDGFLGVGCNSRAVYQDHHGVIWIGANDVLTAFNPQRIQRDENRELNLNITHLGLFHEIVSWQQVGQNADESFRLSNGVEIDDVRFNGLTPWYGIPQQLSLAWDNNYLQFRFVANTTRFTQQMRYSYKLEGFDEGWLPFAQRNEAHYANLRPGAYTFRLKAMDSYGAVSDEIYYRFRIRKPWWDTHIALATYLLIICGVVFIIWRYRKHLQHQKERRRQEELMLHQEVEIARKSVEFKQNFLANMSHEIRTPLTGILGTAELLGQSQLNEQQKELLDILVHSGENLRETLNLVLDYSKIEAGKVKLNQEVFASDDLVKNATNFFHSICKKDIVFSGHTSADLPLYIKADKQRLTQVVHNLLSNAVKFTDSGFIEVSLDAVSEPAVNFSGNNGNILLRFTVKDTGKGISKEEQKLLFQPFSQVEQQADRRFDGTGLGLAICRQLSQLMGGDTGVESKEGAGSSFWFTFLAEPSLQPPALQPNYREVPNGRTLRILLVEDKKVNQKVITMMLKTLGHEIQVAENGLAALEAFENNRFDLILMDVQMPVMDGIAATQKLRMDHKNLPPVVGLSANAFEGDRERYMSQGMDEYLTKPIKQADFEKLLKKLNLK